MSATKKTRQTKTAPSRLTVNDKWGFRLPITLLAHGMSWLEDSKSLARVQCVCRGWHSGLNAAQLDLLWRACYLRSWELESSTDAAICPDPSNTPWKERFRRRQQVETNWREGTFTVIKRLEF